MNARKRTWSAVVGLSMLTVAACGGQGSDLTVQSSAATSPTGLTTAVTAPPLTSAAPPATTSMDVPTVATTESVSSVEPVTPSDPVPVSVPPATSVAPDPTTTEQPAPPPVTTTTSPPVAPPVDGNGAGTVVVLDAGHNGKNGANASIINAPVDAGFGETKACNTTGTETNDGYPEHAFTWEVTNRVRDLLEAAGVTVVMTRDSDGGVGPCVNERAAIGNDNSADAVVSIHGDGAASGDRGFYAMTSERLPNGAGVGEQSLTLASSVRDALVDIGVEPSNYVGSDGLWKRDDLAGLNLSMVPTTMIEMGNMRDADDAALMKSDAGQDLMAAGIAQGILDYVAGR